MTFGADARDRDPSGRARNARPRDGLGRPLPYGATGVERAPEGVRRTVEQTLDEAQRLLDTGRPFHAHEVFEDAWKGEPGPERELWRGLAQLAVGLTHAARGNLPGAASLLRRGADVIEPFAAGTEVGTVAIEGAPGAVAAADVAAVDVAQVDAEIAAAGASAVNVVAVDGAATGAAAVDVAGLVSWARTAAADVDSDRQPSVPVLRRRRPPVLAS
jgi:hypothetical protein